MTLTIRCPAKVNLTLEVLGKRADGYHELRTVFQAVSLSDDLALTRGQGPPLTVTGVEVPVEGNLCLRALAEFRRRCDVPADLGLRLHKRIPVGAGLGGGSSDAAGTLVALDRALGPVGTEALDAMAAAVGSDVAFFLRGGTALGSGRGEIIEPLPAAAGVWLVIARPELQVGTGAAYEGLGPENFSAGDRTAAFVEGLRAGYGLRDLAGGMYNAFECAVLGRYPEIAALKQRLLRAGAEAALLSGSGAAVFGLFAAEASARRAARGLAEAGAWAVAAVTIPGGAEETGEA